MAYEVFERVAVRVDDPVLSIAPQGTIVFNAAACRILVDAKVKYALVLWDRTANKMAIQAVRKGEKNAFTISFNGGQHSASMRARLFLQHIGWNLTKRQSLVTTWNPSALMFEVKVPSQFLGKR